jgi:UPF0755 protein
MLRKILLISLVIFFVVALYSVFVPTSDFPVNSKVKIESGQTEEEILQELQNKNFIRSTFATKVIDRLFLQKPMQVGSFSFNKPLSTWQLMIALRIPPAKVRITIPEGFTKQQVADRLEKNLKGDQENSNFDPEYFLGKIEEGYIFPETYFFEKSASTDEVLVKLVEERGLNVKELSRVPTREEVILASILEREAKDEESMKMVAGILYNRLEAGMPLQVDATILYAKGWKERVTYKDLLHESDYNTYQNKGLPPGAISNPGKVALEAAMNPTNSNYVYYLTGSDGQMYYAKTFEQHVVNKNKYLR